MNLVTQPRMVIVGAGPSGCYLAAALTRLIPNVRVTILDRQPTPFGLVRYGVAADHQHTKAITRQFDRILTTPGIEFFGNVHVTHHEQPGTVTLAELRSRTTAVIIATGLPADLPLRIPGADLPQVFGAGELISVLNTLPDESLNTDITAQLGSHVVVVGFGNVALDVIRFLAKPATEYSGSDINETALNHYHLAPAIRIDALSRSPLSEAKADAAMIRELGKIDGLRVTLHGAQADTVIPPEALPAAVHARVQAVVELAEITAQNAQPRIELHLHFASQPTLIECHRDDESAAAVTVSVANAQNEITKLAASSVITAIGFGPAEHTALGDAALPGLYSVGWARRGPTGGIPENRADALGVAKQIAADFEAGRLTQERETGPPLLSSDVATQAVTYAQWLTLEQHERDHAAPDRSRTKCVNLNEMLAIAQATPRDEKSVMPAPQTPLTTSKDEACS